MWALEKVILWGLKWPQLYQALGTPSVAFSANDLQHGGYGSNSKRSMTVLLVFSVSGESSELDSILKYANRYNISVIGVSCKSFFNACLNFQQLKYYYQKLLKLVIVWHQHHLR